MSTTCIIFPCFNEEKRLCVDKFINYIKDHSDIYFCFVNDGSSDNTIGKLKEIASSCPQRILILNRYINKGKAHAIYIGMNNAIKWQNFNYYGFMDSDLSTPLNEIDNFLSKFALSENIQVIVGSRIRRLGANVNRKRIRHYLGRFFATIVSIYLKLNVYDTQCGAKFFTENMTRVAFSEPFKTKWLFDIELFHRLINQLGVKEANNIIFELPLENWSDISGSKLKFWDFLKAPIDLYKINRYYKKSPKELF